MNTNPYKSIFKLLSIAIIVLAGAMVTENHAATDTDKQNVHSTTIPDQVAPRLQNLGDYMYPVTT